METDGLRRRLGWFGSACFVLGLTAGAWLFLKTNKVAHPRVAILDTGLDFNDQQLAARVGVARSFASRSGERPQDHDGHGTKVARLIADRCKTCELLVYQIADRVNHVESGAMAAAIEEARKAGAHLINISFGKEGTDPLAAEQLRKAFDDGISVFVAAGMGIRNPFVPVELGAYFPQQSDFVTVVGIAQESGDPDLIQNFGDRLDVVFSNVPRGFEASSFATAVVTGIVGERLATVGNLPPGRLRALLRASALLPETLPPGDRLATYLAHLGAGNLSEKLFRDSRDDWERVRVVRRASDGATFVELNAEAAVSDVRATVRRGSATQGLTCNLQAAAKGRVRCEIPIQLLKTDAPARFELEAKGLAGKIGAELRPAPPI